MATFPDEIYLTVDERSRMNRGALDITEAAERARRRKYALEHGGMELPMTDGELGELIRGYTEEKLRDLHGTSTPGTVWRQQLDAEMLRRGLPA